MAGYVARRVRNVTKHGDNDCDDCVACLCSDSNVCNFISFKEYRRDIKSLQYPSASLTSAVMSSVNIIFRGQRSKPILHQSFTQANILHHFEEVIRQESNFSWITCSAHASIIETALVKIVCRIFVRAWARRFRKALKETKDDD